MHNRYNICIYKYTICIIKYVFVCVVICTLIDNYTFGKQSIYVIIILSLSYIHLEYINLECLKSKTRPTQIAYKVNVNLYRPSLLLASQNISY